MTANLQALAAEQQRLYEELEGHEQRGDLKAYAKCEERIVAVENQIAKIDTDFERTVEASKAAESPVSEPVQAKEAKMDEFEKIAGGGSFEDLAGTSSFGTSFASQKIEVDEEAGTVLVNGTKVAYSKAETDILILVAPTSKALAETKEHVLDIEEARRAARGLALVLAGAVQADGSVLNGRGEFYTVENGACFQHGSSRVANGDGTFASIATVKPCLGVGQASRCKHSWALLFNAGAWVTLSKRHFFSTVVLELRKLLGTDEDRKLVGEQIKSWREQREESALPYRAIAQARTDAENKGELNNVGRIPGNPGILGQKLPTGQTVKEAILALNGKPFRASVEIPYNDKGTVRKINPRTATVYTVAQFVDAMGAIQRAAVMHGGEAEIIAIETR